MSEESQVAKDKRLFPAIEEDELIRLRTLFDSFDVNKNGVLETEELRTAFVHFTGQPCSDHELNRLISIGSLDGEREITFKEFVHFCRIASFTLQHGPAGQNRYITLNVASSGQDHERLVKFAGGAIAGAVSRSVVAPLERLKILLQTRTAGSEGSVGLSQALVSMWRKEGVQGMFRGNGLNVLRIAPASAIQFLANDEIKKVMATIKGEQVDVDALAFHERVLAGSAAGAISTVVTYPTDLLRAKLTVERGTERTGLMNVIRQTLRQDGWMGMYRGMVPTLVGVLPYTGFDLAVYSMIKQHVLLPMQNEDGRIPQWATLCGGATAGAVAQTVAFPFDVIRRRMQIATFVPTAPQYSGIADAFRTIWRTEGMPGFTRGLAANYAKVVPSMAITFWCYESFLYYFRTPTLPKKVTS